jgi:hypothetical protein
VKTEQKQRCEGEMQEECASTLRLLLTRGVQVAAEAETRGHRSLVQARDGRAMIVEHASSSTSALASALSARAAVPLRTACHNGQTQLLSCTAQWIARASRPHTGHGNEGLQIGHNSGSIETHIPAPGKCPLPF